MEQQPHRSGVYYGWYIVAVSTAVYMILIGSTHSAFSLFVVPVSREYGLSRADINTALIILSVGNAIFAPFMGRLLDRVPVRRVMVISALLFGASLAGLGISTSLVLSSFLLLIPLPISLLGAGTITMTLLVARWFVDRRGRAMALSLLGMSLGGFIVAPLAGLVVHQFGWRAALIMLGVAGSTALVALSFIVRDAPASTPATADSEADPKSPPACAKPENAAAPPKVSTTLRRLDFWSIALSTAIVTAVIKAVAISLVPLAIEDGLTMLQATSLVSASGGAAIIGKLLLSVFADKIDRILLMTIMFVLGSAVNAALLTNAGYYPLLGCAAFLGLATGALMPVYYALLADRFGTAIFGTVRGLTVPIMGCTGAITVRFAGEVYDRTSSYDLLFAVFIVAQLLAAALIFSTRFVFPKPTGEALQPT